MKNGRGTGWIIAVTCIGLAGTIVVRIAAHAPLKVLASAKPTAAAAGVASWPCSAGIPSVISTIPNDAPMSDQPTMNCFAWQEFIALNWSAAPGQRGVPDPKVTSAQFGAPNATAPTVWETYKANTEVMLPGAAKPASWNSPAPSPSCPTGQAALKASPHRADIRVLSMSSAFGDFSLGETSQASGQWLADQNGNPVWYEIKLNQDEFDTIVRNQFYNATTQQTTASTGKSQVPGGEYQVKLPAGCLKGPYCSNPTTGAIELKAAWRILTDPSQYGRYLTSNAVLVNGDGSCTTATVGLVGLHIIHKTTSQPQFIWATFEQVDNLPQSGSGAGTFSAASCQCQNVIPASCLPPGSGTLYQNCTPSQSQGQSCTPNTSPPYDTVTSGCVYPIQVARSRPLGSTGDPVVATNTAAQQLVKGANANSVFQYYQLIDVLWSTSPQDTYTNARGTPGPTSLSMSGATPSTSYPVANTTMETYRQYLTCLNCHIGAQTPKGTYASDFSFLLGDAYQPGVTAAHVRRQRRLPPGIIPPK